MKHLVVGLLTALTLSSTAFAKTLNFDGVLKKAVENSYDLQISKIDIGISEAGIKEARSEYFPSINLGYNAGYDRDLSDGGSTITPIGDSIILNNTRYQNSASASLQYNLFDFGVRKKQLGIAKKDKEQKQTGYSIELRDLKIELADLYTQALLNYREYASNTELLALNSELFSMQEKLHNCGTKPKTELVEQAIKVARITNKIDSIRTEFQKNLEDLSYYTGEEYNINDLELDYIDNNAFEYVNLEQKEVKDTDLANKEGTTLHIEAVKTDFLDIENLPEYKYYGLEIEKKRAELAILNRQRLPHFRFYTNYYLFGQDKNDYFDTFGDLEDTNLSFRISSTLPVFTGFKNTAQRQRVKLEIERLEKQREQKVAQMKSYYQKIYDEAQDYSKVLSNQEKSLQLVQDKIAMLERLNEQKLIDKVSYLSQKADLISQKIELEQVKITNDSNEFKLKILREPEEKLCKQD